MAFVVIATWTAREGAAHELERILAAMAPLSRKEPWCLAYQVQRALDNERVFLLYEKYVDRAGYEAHTATPHFEQYVRGEAAPYLETRQRAFYESLFD